MARVTSSQRPPNPIPCYHCVKLAEYIKITNISSYDDYEAQSIEVINQIRTSCSSCKGLFSGYGSSSYKADIVIWLYFAAMLPQKSLPVGKGRTSRFSQEDIARWRKLHDTGTSWSVIAASAGITRQALSNLVNERCKQLKTK